MNLFFLGNSRVRTNTHATSSTIPSMPSSLKRKRSLDPTDDAQTNNDSTKKKARLSEAATAIPDDDDDGGSCATSAPSLASPPSTTSPTTSLTVSQLLSDIKKNKSTAV
ncbi:MAG TPA: hypothetical protein VGO47_08185 [Chlamydiales bacterium]|jgi:hypothetical protein|nr:hypothetical protein [Chlamydiales bacterium]